MIFWKRKGNESAKASDSAEKKIGYRDILTQKEYMKLLAANTVNRFGDSIDAIAFTWLIYALTGSAAWSAAIFGLNQLPTMFIQPLAGVWVEKKDKKKIMLWTDIIRGLIVLGFAVTYMTGMLTPWLMVIFTLSISTAEAFRIPAGSAIVPQIIDLKYYSFGNAFNSTLSTIVQLIGYGAAGGIISVFGVQAAMGIDVCSYMISAVLIACMKQRRGEQRYGQFLDQSDEPSDQRDEAHPETKGRDTFLLSGVREGLLLIWKHPGIRNLCILAAGANAALVPFNALETPMVTELLGLGSEALSLSGMAITVGMCIGGVVYPYISRDKNPRHIIVMGGLILSGGYMLSSAGPFFAGNPIGAYGLCAVYAFCMGFGVAMASSSFSNLFMSNVPENYLSRATGIINAIGTAAMPVVSFLISFISVWASVQIILLLSGSVCGIIFLYVGVKKVRFQ